MKANEELWDRLSRQPKPLHPKIPIELTEDIVAARRQKGMTMAAIGHETEVSPDMMRNITYGMLKRINYSVVKVCNYLDIKISDYVND